VTSTATTTRLPQDDEARPIPRGTRPCPQSRLRARRTFCRTRPPARTPATLLGAEMSSRTTSLATPMRRRPTDHRPRTPGIRHEVTTVPTSMETGLRLSIPSATSVRARRRARSPAGADRTLSIPCRYAYEGLDRKGDATRTSRRSRAPRAQLRGPRNRSLGPTVRSILPRTGMRLVPVRTTERTSRTGRGVLQRRSTGRIKPPLRMTPRAM